MEASRVPASQSHRFQHYWFARMQNTVIRKREIYFFIYILYIYIFSFTKVLINSAQSPPSSQFRCTVNRETTSNPTHFTSVLTGLHISLTYHVARNFCSKKNQSVQENMGSDKVNNTLSTWNHMGSTPTVVFILKYFYVVLVAFV